jgi:NTP pyrophosphatase (non-canonical NTP hydrolase)
MKRRDSNLALNVLMEECAEVIKEASKINRFGQFSRHPFIENSPTNIENLTQEIGDVLAILDVIQNETDIELDWNKVLQARDTKKHKLDKFLPYIDT